MFDIDTAPVDRLAGRLAGVADDLADTDQLLSRAGAEVARIAGPRTPRRSGRLASSLAVSVDGDAAGVRWGVGHAVYVNFGTRTMRAQPFATDALKAAETTIERLTREWAADALLGA